MRFRDQVVWITGASSGIGEALARGFAAEGARVVLSSRRESELERVRQTCARPEEHIVMQLDLARADLFPAIVNKVLQQCVRIDILVNNGGVSQRSLAMDAALEVERAIMELDYFAPVALTKAVLASMVARGSGHIVVTSSVMGYVGTPGRSTYAAAKHALHGYFDSLRAEVWKHGIHVTLACPGYVKTHVSANALGPDGKKHDQIDSTHEHGISADKCANAIIRGVAGRKNEIYVGGWEVAGIYLQRCFPKLFARVVRNMTFSVDAGH